MGAFVSSLVDLVNILYYQSLIKKSSLNPTPKMPDSEKITFLIQDLKLSAGL